MGVERLNKDPQIETLLPQTSPAYALALDPVRTQHQPLENRTKKGKKVTRASWRSL